MDYSRRLMEERGPWIPVTPAKPMPIRPQPMNSNGSQPNWIDAVGVGFPAEYFHQNASLPRSNFTSATATSNGVMNACYNSMDYVDQRGMSTWEEALLGNHRTATDIVDNPFPETSCSSNTVGSVWDNIGFSELLALSGTPAGAASILSQRGENIAVNSTNFPISNSHVRGSLQYTNRPIADQNFVTSSNLSNNHSNFSPHAQQYGLPVPYRPTFDLNSPSQTFADAVSNGDASLQFSPITPPQIKGGAVNQHSEIAEHVSVKVSDLVNNEVDQGSNNGIEMQCQDSLLHSVVNSPSAAASTLLKENQNADRTEEHGIDLNKTPVLKPKRKKVRPRVLIEGKKPSKTPYHRTKQPSAKETPSVKRKYVRKNGLKTSNTPAANIEEEVNADKVILKSAKKVLNFDLVEVRDGSRSSTTGYHEGLLSSIVDSSSSRCKENSQSQTNEICSGVNSETKLTTELRQGLEAVVENSPARLAFDLNCTSTQPLEDFISLPDKPIPTAPPPTRRELTRESLSALLSSRDNTVIIDTCLNNGEQYHPIRNQHTQSYEQNATASILQSDIRFTNQNNLIRSNQIQLEGCDLARGSKRGYCHTIAETDLQSLNPLRSRGNTLQTYQQKFGGHGYHRNSSTAELPFSEINKKTRIERDLNVVNSSLGSSIASFLENPRKEMACKENAVNANHIAFQAKSRSDIQLGNVSINHPNGAGHSAPNLQLQAVANQNCRLPDTWEALLSQTQKPSCEQSEKTAYLDQTKNRSKVPAQICELSSLTTTLDCSKMPGTPQKMAPIPGDKLGNKNFSRPRESRADLAVDNQVKKPRRGRPPKTLDSGISVSRPRKKNESLQKREMFMYTQHPVNEKPRGSLDMSWLSMDEIINKIDRLTINDMRTDVTAPEQYALVPFGREGQMVPYEGLFNGIKKKQLRPKVNLDAETDRVWKLLMGIQNNDGVEGTTQDKEKWWEEERKVFRGRADSFIARMHLIQGDRRFSKWKGSVVDSVVGVFLTQNVSDILSSSAFMCLVARFPLKTATNNNACSKEGTQIIVEEPEVCIVDSDDNISWQEKMQDRLLSEQDYVDIRELQLEERETGHSNESFGSNVGGSLNPGTGCQFLVETGDRRAVEDVVSSQNSVVSSQNSIDSTEFQTADGNIIARIRGESFLGNEVRRQLEDVVSSQVSVDSSSICTDDRIRSYSYFNSGPEMAPSCTSNSVSNHPSFTELLRMGGTPLLQEYYSQESGSFAQNLNSKSCQGQSEGKRQEKKSVSTSGIDGWKELFSVCPSTSVPKMQLPNAPHYLLQMTPETVVQEVESPKILGTDSRFSLSLDAPQMTTVVDPNWMCKTVMPISETVSNRQKLSTNAEAALKTDTYPLASKYLGLPDISAGQETLIREHQNSWNDLQKVRDGTFIYQSSTATESTKPVETQAQMGCVMQQSHSNFVNLSHENLDAEVSTSLTNKQTSQKEQIRSSDGVFSGKTFNASKAKGKPDKEKKKEFDWDSLRRDVYQKGLKREKSNNTMDSLDWEAVRTADVSEIANAIKERGMNNMLAERIKAFLNRLVSDHGSIDLEWLRDVPPDKAKEYLLSIRGLGLKSVECVRLLTLHNLAFPVDTNVGRIAVRLGWVPLQPLPESLQLHLLELYPMLETIQKFLWPRLCTLDQPTLYELHYQLITFGKVFCTKSKPNCNACPMRAECRHFASAFASARLALPGPEEKGIVTSFPSEKYQNPHMDANPMSLPLLEANLVSGTRIRKNECEPIIEEPATPENDYAETLESDIEDAFGECPNEIPSINLDIEEFTITLQNYMQENKMELQEGDLSNALVAITPRAASIPVPKLKNVNRLRTEHLVYELPDSHPLLEGVPRRDPDDHCSYLLAIWTPGETAESIQPPEGCCSSQASGNLCSEKTCFSCNSTREASSQTIRGTLLIPCRTAMRGSFPLNGTYFQVNEVFADHDSSLNPIDVPRAWIWNLPRRTVLFGTSVSTIFKGQTTQEIQNCFWKGFVCVRGFDQKSRAPRPLMARLHFPASKSVKNKLYATKE
ncbi:hypothetical protein MKW98_026363 [Papaver atlanticum]|uniref:HhH-GPD domain-containing protein n=1 Tax=Papaver atlanticum TaxID=357466 RepID=A0AAD4SP10_9MAGN|nr:hypothetical protein MKW98_026363 [Papaver atlanticum]